MQKSKLVILMVPLIIFFTVPSFGEKVTKKNVKEEVQEAAKAIKNYSVEQRDEAVQNEL